ncbi:MAG: M23 family metallopeptidase [Candidatus Eutrophobiaceae bacterium]
MNISNIQLIWHNSRGRTLTLGRRWICLLFMAVALICGAIGWNSGRVSAAHQTPATYGLHAELVKKDQQLQGLRIKLEDSRVELRDNLEIFSTRFGELQARSLRLDTLGLYLASAANISENLDFDALAPPGVGGLDLASLDVSTDAFLDEMLHSVESLSVAMDSKEQEMMALSDWLIRETVRQELMPSGLPVKSAWVSSVFGFRSDPFTGKKEHHKGIDFSSLPNTPIYSVGDGIVTWSNRYLGYGLMVEINQGNGYSVRYAHNKQNLVKVGEKVAKGQMIARMGSSGRSTGTHLHFEVLHNGNAIDPRKFIDLSLLKAAAD